MLLPAGAAALCLLRPTGLRALLGLDGGLAPRDLLWALSLLGLPLRDLGKGEESLLALPVRMTLTMFLTRGEEDRLPCCLECDGDWRECLSVRLTGEKEGDWRRWRLAKEGEEEEVVLLKLACLPFAAG